MYKPCNIFSGSKDGLSAALTFPTELSFKKGNIKNHYPVADKNGNEFPDAETAYHYWKKNIAQDRWEELYIRIAVAKFRQYPQLIEHITKRGGVEWLETCSHFTGAKTERFKRWEGIGYDSKFIRLLIEAYKRVKQFQANAFEFVNKQEDFMFFELLMDAGVPQELAGKCAEVLERENATEIYDRTEEELKWFEEARQYAEHKNDEVNSQLITEDGEEYLPSESLLVERQKVNSANLSAKKYWLPI